MKVVSPRYSFGKRSLKVSSTNAGERTQDQAITRLTIGYHIAIFIMSSFVFSIWQKGHIQEPRQEDQLQNEPDSDIPLLSFSQKDLLYFCLPCIRRNLFPEQDVHWGSCPRLQDTVVSAFTNGAIYVFLLVITGCMLSTPSFSRSAAICSLGRGVILSIMVHGKATTSLHHLHSL